MSSGDEIKRRRLVRLHGEFLEAAEKWPTLYHTAIKVDESSFQSPAEATLFFMRYTPKWWHDLRPSGELWSNALYEHSWENLLRETQDARFNNYLIKEDAHVLDIDSAAWLGRFTDPHSDQWICPAYEGIQRFSQLKESILADSYLNQHSTLPLKNWVFNGCPWLANLYKVFPQDPVGWDHVLIRWLPSNVFLASAKAIELRIDSGEPLIDSAPSIGENLSVLSVDDTNDLHHEGEPQLNNSERDILSIIREANNRLTTKKVLKALETKNGAVAESTTKLTLATLVRRGLLTNRQDKMPKGYGLPEWD